MAGDFFISYTQADRPWAEWIAWQLDADGYSVVLQAWDFTPGTDWAHEMQRATADAAHTIAVLSPDYARSAHGEAEWRVAYASDPTGEKGLLLPVRVAPGDAPGLLKTRVAIDLVGMSEQSARRALLDGVRGSRAKPPSEPAFPGAPSPVFPPLAADELGDELLIHRPVAFGEIVDPYEIGVDRRRAVRSPRCRRRRSGRHRRRRPGTARSHLAAPRGRPRDARREGHRELTGDAAQRLRNPIGALLRRADEHILVAGGLTDTELECADRRGYSPAALQQMRSAGVGEYMIAAPELVNKLSTGVHPGETAGCPSGIAVVKAAIDWRLAGLLRPVPSESLEPLHRLYLVGAVPTAQQFQEGIDWATRALYETTRLLSFVPSLLSGASQDGFAAHDFVVEHARRASTQPISDATHDLISRSCSDPGDLFAIGLAAYDHGRIDRATEAFGCADSRGHATGALNLGLLLAQQRQGPEALAAFRRADERGSRGGAVSLGRALQLGGDPAGAEAAFRRADERGDAAGAFNHGLLLEQRGELEAAEAAYRRGDERGSPGASANLAALLLERGLVLEAEAAMRRAAERGSASGRNSLVGLLAQRGDVSEAAAAAALGDATDSWWSPAGGAIPSSETSFEGSSGLQRDAELDAFAGAGQQIAPIAAHAPSGDHGAEALYERAMVAHRRGELERAEGDLRGAADLGHAAAADLLATILKARGAPIAEVQDAYRRAAALGHVNAGHKLERLIAERARAQAGDDDSTAA